MDGDFPWIYVAMIVIAFISWVLNRIQEFTNAQKEKKLRDESPEEYRRIVAEQQGQEEAWLPEEEAEPEAPSPPSPRPDPGEALRELYKALGGAPAETATAPKPPRSTPPPIRRSEKAVANVTSRKPVPLPQASATPASMPARRISRGKKKQTGDSFAAKNLLKSRSGLRQAMILKEILGDPKGTQ